MKKMNKLLWLPIALVLCSSTTGCMFDYLERLTDRGDAYDDGTYEPYDYSDDYDYNELEIDPGYIAGDMGAYSGFDDPTYEATGYSYGTDSTTVELHSGEDYWIMARLNITGSLDAFEVGEVYEFDSGGYAWDDSTGEAVTYVSVTGCSGPTHGNYTYDAGSQNVVVVVDQGVNDNDRILTFQAEYVYEGETQVVDGSFGYTVY